MKKTLWTRTFILLVASTAISAIAGEAFNLPFSLTVFNETKSSFLSSLMLIAGFVPDILLGLFLAPFIEKWNKKKVIIILDCLFILLYILGGLYFQFFGFHYGFLVSLSLCIATLSILYHMSYYAWFPDLITKGMEQQAMSVTFIIYPLASVAMAPLSAYLYKQIGLHNMFYFMAATLVISVFLEAQLPYEKKELPKEETDKPKEGYFASLKGGFQYFREEKGLFYISLYVAITSSVAEAMHMLTQLVFQSTPGLTEVMFGTLIAVGMAARVITGSINSKFSVPQGKRYNLTRAVYFIFEPLMALLLFQNQFWLYIIIYFIMNGLGQVTGTLRNAAFANYLRPDMRARAGSLQSFLVSVGMLIAYLSSGLLGEIAPYRHVALGLAILNTLAVYFLIHRKKDIVKPIYEYERPKDEEEEATQA